MSQEHQEIQFDAEPQEAAPVQPAPTTPVAKGNNYKMIAFSVVFIAFGIFMLLAPDLMNGATAEGRNALYKTILIMIWGIPGGIAAIVIGGFFGYRVYASSRNSTPGTAPVLAGKASSSKAGLNFSLKGSNPSKAFSDKVAPSKRELEAKSAKRKELRAKS
jgi:hypothetical protein